MDIEKYRHKPIEVDAILVSDIVAAQVNMTLYKSPQWLQDLIIERKVEISPHIYGIVAYPFPGVPRLGAGRDYLLHDPNDGTVNVCPPEVLAQLYELV
jgi:hypothetical protein